MAWFGRRACGRTSSPAGKMFVLGASVATLVGLSVLVTGGFAQSSEESPDVIAAAKKRGFVAVCTQRRGGNHSKGDLNIRLRAWCAKGQKPLKLALWPVARRQPPQPSQPPQGSQPGEAAAEYGVANVFVARGGDRPSRWATYSVALGSPVGSTTGGQFRFTCTPAQSPCKISLGAAVLSSESGRAVVYARITVHKQNGDAVNTPMIHCEYVDGPANRIQRVPLETAIGEIREPLTMDAGGSFDCGSGQPGSSGRADEIWVTSTSNVDNAFYDVWTTVTFGRESR